MATSETHDPVKVYLLHMAKILDEQAAAQESILCFLHKEILDAMAKEDSPSKLLAECEKGCGRSAAPGWKTCCRRCSDGKSHHGKQCQQGPFRLPMFGSRRYGAALPSSDIDLVLELKWDESLNQTQQDDQIYHLLNYFYERFKHAPLITQLLNISEQKSTLSFRIESIVYSIKVDLTCCMGLAEYNHRPSQVTECIKSMLSGLDDGGRAMVRLTVDCMKRNHLCWNRKGAIGKQMKAVHWVLFVIAWLKGSTDNDPGTVQLASSASPLSSRLMKLVSFFQRSTLPRLRGSCRAGTQQTEAGHRWSFATRCVRRKTSWRSASTRPL